MHDWASLAGVVVERWGTPAYVLRASEIEYAFLQLSSVTSPLPVRHWLSCKTLAVPPLLAQWNAVGRGIEVVSPFELRAALNEGFDGDRILVNGTAKHRWLQAAQRQGLRVQFDSLQEIRTLAPVAAERQWQIGIRIHTDENRDPDDRRFFDHFGITHAEVPQALDLLAQHGIVARCISFHLHSNLRTIEPYLNALDEVGSVCDNNGLSPDFLDIGGGLPAPGESIDGLDGSAFDLAAMSRVYTRASELLPSVRELWLENGRFISSRGGVLLIRVRDIKYRSDMRYLICDGGRVNHAFPSDWQSHAVTILPARSGGGVPTTICGPTCMAYDVLIRTSLPHDIESGDLIIWHNAGAYHLSWETRFSFGLAPIIWFDTNDMPKLVRPQETFGSWWPTA